MKTKDVAALVVVAVCAIVTTGVLLDMNDDIRDAVKDIEATHIGTTRAAHEAVRASMRHERIIAYADTFGIPVRLSEAILGASDRNNMPPSLIFRVVRVESAFNPRATSYVGAVGLMQVKPSTARTVNPTVTRDQLYDIDINLDIGQQYLKMLIDRYDGDTVRALAAFNAGPTRHDRAHMTGEYTGLPYAEKVLR